MMLTLVPVAAVFLGGASALESGLRVLTSGKEAARGGGLSRRGALGGLVLGATLAPLPSRADRYDEWKAEKERKERAKAAWAELPAAAPEEGQVGGVAPPGARLGASSNTYSSGLSVEAAKGFGEPLWNVMRVQEATAQQERLVTTGKYKDVQRANIKYATRLMLDNYRLLESVEKASASAGARQAEALEKGRSAAGNLQTLLEYFDSSVNSLNVASIDASKQQFILRALTATRKELDDFLAFMPADQVEATRKLIDEENKANEAEYKKAEAKDYINPAPA